MAAMSIWVHLQVLVALSMVWVLEVGGFNVDDYKWKAMDKGLNHAVYTITADSKGILYAGGVCFRHHPFYVAVLITCIVVQHFLTTGEGIDAYPTALFCW